jgi:ADP-ribose pyrophosphatase YjhB (NUDIX family)
MKKRTKAVPCYAACALIIAKKRKRYVILCVENKRFGGLTLPVGKLEEGEWSKRACVREIEEETDLRVAEDALALVFEGIHRFNGDRLVRIYHVYVAEGRVAPGLNREGARIEWLTYTELLTKSPFCLWYRDALPDGIRHLTPTIIHAALPPLEDGVN